MITHNVKDLLDVRMRSEPRILVLHHTLEGRVAERTQQLQAANQSKSRFLAAASHDLLQPLNAARLFVAALGDRRLALPTRALVNQTSTALDSVEDLLEARFLLRCGRRRGGVHEREGKHRGEQYGVTISLCKTSRVDYKTMLADLGIDADTVAKYTKYDASIRVAVTA